jgi:hypothetical protein
MTVAVNAVLFVRVCCIGKLSLSLWICPIYIMIVGQVRTNKADTSVQYNSVSQLQTTKHVGRDQAALTVTSEGVMVSTRVHHDSMTASTSGLTDKLSNNSMRDAPHHCKQASKLCAVTSKVC